MSTHVVTHEHPTSFLVLHPVQTASTTHVEINPDPHYFFSQIPPGSILAVDVETTGLDPLRDQVVGLGVSDGDHTAYWDWRSLHATTQLHILDRLSQYRLVGHNIFFDARCLELLRPGLGWEWDTHALLRLLATEGWDGQEWGLKWAQVNLLGWEQAGDVELDAWLVQAGITTSPGNPDKSRMSEAPPEILGTYCGLDAYSTYLLLVEVLLPAAEEYPALLDYYCTSFHPHILAHVSQWFRGIQLDIPQLQAYSTRRTEELEKLTSEFLRMPDVAPHVEEFRLLRRQVLVDSEPEKFLLRRLGEEPKKYTKAGNVSKVWMAWNEKRKVPPVVSKNWEKWDSRVRRHDAGEMAPNWYFNLASGDNLRWLLFEKLGFPILEWTSGGKTGENKKPAVGADVYGAYGEVGAALLLLAEVTKELEYITAYLELADEEGVLRPSFRMPGTLTGRLSSSFPNLQQLPKTEGLLSCFVARPGYRLVELDFSALEQVVLAELSQDKTLLQLYGPGAAENDVYLFVGSQLPILGDEIRAAGYDPACPTPEGIYRGKKEAKRARSITKTVVLASSYGAGPPKIQKTLSLQGINLSLGEVKKIHAAYWELYSGVRDYQQTLEAELADTGVVLNGVGRPLGVDPSRKKDVLNSVVQSTGHDLLVMYTQAVLSRLRQEGVVHYYSVLDWHDEVVLEVPEESAAYVAQVLEEEVHVLNQKLGASVPLRGTATVSSNFSEFKLG